MYKILFEVIINNQCNKRCSYCDLNFKNKSFSFRDLDKFIIFLNSNKDFVKYYHINFFGGEPLLSFDKIKYFVENIQFDKIKYSIGTNGLLLDKDKLNFFKQNKFTIHLSIDNIDCLNLFEKVDISGYEDLIEINFINDPYFMHNSKKVFDFIKDKNFYKINIMPVFSTKKWDKQSLIFLYEFKRNVDSFHLKNVQYFSYFNGLSSDIQYILDTDLSFYKDIDSLLWLQKQYKIISEDLREKIQNNTKSFSLEENNYNILDLVNKYDKKELLELIFKIPKVIGTYQDNFLIDKIIKNGT
ncbi:MAG: radical SAM protein [Candidatus Gracilibacteria bacterium]